MPGSVKHNIHSRIYQQHGFFSSRFKNINLSKCVLCKERKIVIFHTIKIISHLGLLHIYRALGDPPERVLLNGARNLSTTEQILLEWNQVG